MFQLRTVLAKRFFSNLATLCAVSVAMSSNPAEALSQKQVVNFTISSMDDVTEFIDYNYQEGVLAAISLESDPGKELYISKQGEAGAGANDWEVIANTNDIGGVFDVEFSPAFGSNEMDGSAIVAFNHEYNHPNFPDIFEVARLDQIGNKVWGKTFPDHNIPGIITDIDPASQGGYIFSLIPDIVDSKLVKLQDNGDLEWAKKYNITDIGAVVSQSNGNFVFGADANQGIALVQVNATGAVAQSYSYKPTAYPSAKFIIKDIIELGKNNDRGFAVVGYTIENSNSKERGFVLVVDQNFNLGWYKDIEHASGNVRFNGVTKDGNRDIVVTGGTGFGLWSNHYLQKFSLNGSMLWSRFNYGEASSKVEKLSSGGFILGSGYTNSSNDMDAMLVSTDQAGMSLSCLKRTDAVNVFRNSAQRNGLSVQEFVDTEIVLEDSNTQFISTDIAKNRGCP